MADVGTQELSHRQEHGFIEKHGVISKIPDKNSVGPESVASRDKSWDIAGIRHKLEQIRSTRIDDEDEVLSAARSGSDSEEFDDAHLWHKVSGGKGKLEWDSDAMERVEDHGENVGWGRRVYNKFNPQKDH